MVFIYFNATNCLFCVFLMRKDSFASVLMGSVAFIILLAQTIHMAVYAKQYYGLDNSFNLDKPHLKIFLAVFLGSRLIGCGIITMLAEKPLMVCVGMMGTQGVVIIMMGLVRPFTYFLTNVLIIAGEAGSLSFFACIYTFEGMKESEQTSGWAMLGIMMGTVVIGGLNFFHSVYLDCMTSVKKKTMVHVGGLV